MRYSIEPRYRIFAKVYGCLFFIINIGKNIIGKYSQNLWIMHNHMHQMHSKLH